MTDRLYYTDPYSREFDATVLSVEASGGRGRVRLDRTGFYPTSGGQPFDIGTLGGAHVVDVVDEGDGGISHVVDTGDTLQSRRACSRRHRLGAAASITCSSTQASICCRPPSIGCSACAPSAFTSASIARRSIWRARRRRPRWRPRKTRRIGSSGRTGRSPSDLRQPKRPPGCRSERNRSVKGPCA